MVRLKPDTTNAISEQLFRPFLCALGALLFPLFRGLLASTSTLEAWGIPAPSESRFAEIPWSVALGPLRQDGLTAVAVPDRTWRDFGTWGGIGVEALLSHAFLKKYAWTIDFERRVYLFHAASDTR